MKWLGVLGCILLVALVLPKAGGAALAAEDVFGLAPAHAFSLSTDSPEGYERRTIHPGGNGFDFSTILPVKARVAEREPVLPGMISVAITLPLAVDLYVRHLPSEFYIDARSAAESYMRLIYDDVVVDDDAGLSGAPLGNPAFALAIGVRRLDDGSYGRMARAAVVSSGGDAIILHAEFDYRDYDRLEPALSRLFGGLRMEEDVSGAGALRLANVGEGADIVIPRGWAMASVDLGDGRTPALKLTLGGSGYPELTIARLDSGMEEARQKADALMDTFVRGLEANRNVTLSERGERVMTEEGAAGPALYLLSRRWRVIDKDIPMITFTRVMRGQDGRIWQLNETSPDQSRFHSGRDADVKADMYQWSLAAKSAAGVIGRSIFVGPQAAIEMHSVRRLGR